MNIEKLYYDNVCNSVYDTHGKQYTIKEHRGWKFVNVNNKKIGISSLREKIQIRNFEDVVYHWIFSGWFYLYPCPAIEKLVNQKLKQINKH